MSYKTLILLIPMFMSCQGLSYFDIPVEGDSQNGYFITTLVGTPSQRINFLLDTGSSNIAVAAAPQQLTNVKYFAYNSSSTFRSTNDEIHLRYEVGDWKGFLGTDIFNPCSTKNCSILCNIGCMTTAKEIFDINSKFQGILGLAYSSLSKPNSSVGPFLDIFIKTYDTRNMFSLDLGGPLFSGMTMAKSVGNFRIGLNSADSYNYIYTPIVRERYYEITVLNVRVNWNVTAPFKCQDMNKHISDVDSGATELMLPSFLYEFIISEIKNFHKLSSLRKYWVNETVICLQDKPVNLHLFPNLTITLYHSKNSTFDLHVSPELYLWPITHSMYNCAMLRISTSSFGVVIGSSILKGFHVLFDRENKRIGFADSKWKSGGSFVSSVSNAIFHSDEDFDSCIRNELPDDNTISPVVIILLVGICIMATLFLYALLSWIWKYHVLGADNVSDTSSLIEDND